MTGFEKIVNPCTCNVYGRTHPVNAYAKIEYVGTRLSIYGVVGPKSNGGCVGSVGQCVDEIRNGTPATGWNNEMLRKFCDCWDLWHLNDMRPYCQHQKALGWDKLACKNVTLYHYSLTHEYFMKQRELKNRTNNKLGAEGHATLTEEEKELWNLPIKKTSWKPLDDPRYEPRKKADWYSGATEEKTLGWLFPDEHPEGILTKPCPVCGYKYGTTWKTEQVPENVLQFLYNLPDSTRDPAWV
ncbi:hypothetical protein [Gemmiger formicilis]|uniref:hypothetical protein n=1 Tax=Gemmiger formicilis TaxID=745368 RepID=UPI00351FB449